MTVAAGTISASHARGYLLLWLIGGSVACLSALLGLAASHVDGTFLPVGNDSFYHARRILDAVPDLTRFYQFDPRIHAPEGSLIVWPWGYDFGMAVLAKLGMAAGLVDDPMTLLAFIPPAAVFVTVALTIGVTRRVGLSLLGSALVVLCIAISPLTQILHAVGMLDHHYAELILWLASIWALLGWLRPDSTARSAALAAAIPGLAPAFHSDLFILQIPLVLAVLLFRLRREQHQLPHARLFAGVLCAASLAVALPSLALRQGRFEFFTLSWFHVYAALATSVWIVWLADAVPRRSWLVIGAAVLAVPGLTQVLLAGNFVAGHLAYLDAIDEARSPFRMAAESGGIWRVSAYYSLLIWTAPAVLAGCLYELWRARRIADVYLWSVCAVGLALMLAQFRFHYFGFVPLSLALVIWVERFANRRPAQHRFVLLAFGLALVVAYVPAIRGRLFLPPPPANDFDYAITRSLYLPLAAACRAQPGIVLAAADDGHYVRFHTECSVIANNFIVTAQQEHKLREVEELLGLSAAEFASRDLPVRYIFVHLRDMFGASGSGRRTPVPLEQVAAANPRLVRELILSEPATLPARLELMEELRFQGADGHPYARLFRLRVAPEP